MFGTKRKIVRNQRLTEKNPKKQTNKNKKANGQRISIYRWLEFLFGIFILFGALWRAAMEWKNRIKLEFLIRLWQDIVCRKIRIPEFEMALAILDYALVSLFNRTYDAFLRSVPKSRTACFWGLFHYPNHSKWPHLAHIPPLALASYTTAKSHLTGTKFNIVWV